MSASRTRLSNAAHQAMLQRTELQRALGLARTEAKPSALAERGKYHVKSVAHDAAHLAKHEATTHRVVLGVAGTAAVLWIFRDPIRDKGPKLFSRMGDSVKNLAATISRQLDPDPKSEDYLSTPKAQARAAKKKLKQAQAATLVAARTFQNHTEDKMKPFSETARDTRDKASELAERTAENARQTAEAAKARVQDGYDRARAATSDLAAKGREQADVAKHAAGAAYEKGKEKASVATSRVREFAEDQPLTLLAGALAAGLLVGAIVSKKDEIK